MDSSDVIDMVIGALEDLKVKKCPECGGGGGYTGPPADGLMGNSFEPCYHCDGVGYIIDASSAVQYLRDRQYEEEF